MRMVILTLIILRLTTIKCNSKKEQQETSIYPCGGNSICSVRQWLKNCFDALNGYDENLAYEDLDFWIRCCV
jgi:hypothetical protein